MAHQCGTFALLPTTEFDETLSFKIIDPEEIAI
jgi:hypothetical protein